MFKQPREGMTCRQSLLREKPVMGEVEKFLRTRSREGSTFKNQK